MAYENVLSEISELEKKYKRKYENLPLVRQIIYRRTFGIVMNILSNIQGIPFEKFSMNLYFYCKDLQMKQFTRSYESQLELAAIDSEKFLFSLYGFYNSMALRIKKENLYKDFFEFYFKCARKRSEMRDNDKYEDKVLASYIDLLTQQMEFLRPNKFDYSSVISGISTSGELLLSPDPYAQLDIVAYTCELDKKKDKGSTSLSELYAKYGFEIHSENDIDKYVARDKNQTCTTYHLLPFINEYTYDILPHVPFSCSSANFGDIRTVVSPESIAASLSSRNRTLPTNGAIVVFRDNPLFKSLLLKEVLYDDTVFMLYRLSFLEDGDISGVFDTKSKFFFLSTSDDEKCTEISNALTTLILFCYASFVKNEQQFRLEYINAFVKQGVQIQAEGYLQGGRLKNVYSAENVGTGARKGNENYTTEEKAIQGYIRRLPEGQKASEEAREYAERLGYVLELNETYVRPFVKNVFKLRDLKED